MTIIVWDGVTLATDTEAYHGNSKYNTEKAWYEIARDYSRCIVSGVGTLRSIHIHKRWFLNGGKAKDFPLAELGNHYYQFIVVTKEGLYRYEGTPDPILYGNTKCAFGEGSDFAYGALAMNATSAQAVRACLKYSSRAGGGLKTYSLKGETNDKER
tara:strand:- start:245 stop:712 length:468 start_codon:yes stop_codon:yes gene_type:complete